MVVPARLTKAVAVAALAAATAACQTAVGDRMGADELPALEVAFAGGGWDGATIPPGQHCRKFGGEGATPPLAVRGIPEGANAVVVAFNDESYQPLSYDGGHGKVGFWTSGGEASLPAVPGNTASLPEGTFLEAKNRATGDWASPGYLPPCSGGQGNLYSAVVEAGHKDEAAGGTFKPLAIGRIVLGRY